MALLANSIVAGGTLVDNHPLGLGKFRLSLLLIIVFFAKILKDRHGK